MQDLIERLKKATGPDRELDRAIGFAALGWKHVKVLDKTMIDIGGGDLYPDHAGSLYPSPTESLDVALTLVPVGMGWMVAFSQTDSKHPGAVVFPASKNYATEDFALFGTFAATPAIALCIAALEARSVATVSTT